MALKDFGGKVWEGIFKDFSEVPVEKDVFEESIWKEKILKRATDLRTQATIDKTPVPRAAMSSEYALPFVISMLVKEGAPLKVLDFGGGLGTSYISLVPMLSEKANVQFTVIENAAVCSLGKDFFKGDEQITFKEVIPSGRFDVVHAGSSMHYVSDWLEQLDKFAKTEAEYILFSDLPAGNNRTFVTAQWFHGKKIPVRFWNFQEFRTAVETRGYELTFKSNYRGYYINRDEDLPTANFSEEYRLREFCQLVFRKIKH